MLHDYKPTNEVPGVQMLQCVHCGDIVIGENLGYKRCEKTKAVKQQMKMQIDRLIADSAHTAPPPRGPGTCLHDKIKAKIGVVPTRGCGCERYIAKMNTWGPEKCREPRKLDFIVKRLRKAAKKSGWLMAIKAAVPGAKRIIRKMVLSAVDESAREIEVYNKTQEANNGKPPNTT